MGIFTDLLEWSEELERDLWRRKMAQIRACIGPDNKIDLSKMFQQKWIIRDATAKPDASPHTPDTSPHPE
jgi:hypothetical protein